MAKKRKIDVKTYKKQLTELREEIEALSEVTEEARQPVELDQTMVGRLSRMDALQTRLCNWKPNAGAPSKSSASTLPCSELTRASSDIASVAGLISNSKGWKTTRRRRPVSTAPRCRSINVRHIAPPASRTVAPPIILVDGKNRLVVPDGP